LSICISYFSPTSPFNIMKSRVGKTNVFITSIFWTINNGDSTIFCNRIFISVNFVSIVSSFTVHLAVTGVPRYFSDYTSVKFGISWPLNRRLSVMLHRYRFTLHKYDAVTHFFTFASIFD
jgi:hypothetical protein